MKSTFSLKRYPTQTEMFCLSQIWSKSSGPLKCTKVRAKRESILQGFTFPMEYFPQVNPLTLFGKFYFTSKPGKHPAQNECDPWLDWHYALRPLNV